MGTGVAPEGDEGGVFKGEEFAIGGGEVGDGVSGGGNDAGEVGGGSGLLVGWSEGVGGSLFAWGGFVRVLGEVEELVGLEVGEGLGC